MTSMVRQVARARGIRKAIVGVRLPGAPGKASASGGLLPAGPGPRGTVTFARWLADGAAAVPAGSRG